MFDERLIEKIRGEFPRAEADATGRKRVFFDSGAGTLVVRRAAEAEARARVDYCANTEAPFTESKKAEETIYKGRCAVADLVNAPYPETIVSGESATSLMFMLSYAIGRELTGSENVVTSEYEHYTNLSPWLELKERGLLKEIRSIPLRRDDGSLDLTRLGSMIDNHTKIVAVSAASNALGTKTPLVEIGKAAREVGAYFVVDAVHHILHGPIDVQALDCDFLVFSGYKLFSRHGSFMYGKLDHLERLRPYKVTPAPEHPPEKWELGTRDQAQFAAIAGVIDYLTWLSEQVRSLYSGKFTSYSGRAKELKIAMDAIQGYEKILSRAMLEGIEDAPGLLQIPHVKIYGLTDSKRLGERDPTFLFRVKDHPDDLVVEKLWTDHAIAIRSEGYYSKALEIFGIPTAIRGSLAHYNTVREIRQLLRALEKME
jgi:cysteine desulfurase family protein (TIGR01976 family)